MVLDRSMCSFCFGFFIEVSPEEQQLQAVAEGLAASVLHSSSSSNLDVHARDASHHEDNNDGDVQNNLIDMQCNDKAQVTDIHISWFILSFLSCNCRNSLQNKMLFCPSSSYPLQVLFLNIYYKYCYFPPS